MTAVPRLRCAIYTRKSSEEGLDQEFNSLDAQREACAAFVTSQAGLGWRLSGERYDDGGISGGTMERPALQRLLRDIRDRRIDVVVVYKIDRLTRSLADFAKIVEVFDASDISFVSVTQQFNTTTSMGRLTLNVLLSFAQFEREVTAERIRDKIAASKRKGIWMGGTVPLGFEVRDRKLLVKEPEASFVRKLFSRYLELRSVPAVAAEVTQQAVAAREGASVDQPVAYARRVGSGMLYKLLSNPIYIGKLRHRQNTYDGEHQSIIDADQFAEVQALLAAQAATPRGSTPLGDAHLLNGILYDDTGDRMCPTHARTRGKRFRYYVSRRIKGTRRIDSAAWRIPASTIDGAVVNFAISLLSDRVRLSEWIVAHAPTCSVQPALDTAASLAGNLQEASQPDRRDRIRTLFSRIVLGTDSIAFNVNVAGLVRLIGTTSEAESASAPCNNSDEDDHGEGNHSQQLVELHLPIKLRRRGNEMRLLIEGENHVQKPDTTLVKMIARAHLYLEQMIEQPTLGSSGVAAMFGVDRADVGRVLPLAFLAPRLVDQILGGSQPADLSARQLVRQDLPNLWSEQQRSLS